MGHSVHPKSYRIRRIGDWEGRWFAKKNVASLVREDFCIRDFLKKELRQASVAGVEIERSPGKLSVIISSARPGLIIGKGGVGIESLKKNLEKHIRKQHIKGIPSRELRIEIREIKGLWASSAIVGRWIAQQLEKRMPYRRVLRQAVERIKTQKEVEGCRVEVAGRLDGLEIARTEWLLWGKLPRQTIRADIDFAQDEARCTYGTIGIKVWIYKGEKFEEPKKKKV